MHPFTRKLLIGILLIINLKPIASPNSSNSLLAKGSWYKMRIEQSGVQKLSFQQLKEIGINFPNKVKVFGYNANKLSKDYRSFNVEDLIQIPIIIENEMLFFFMEAGGTIEFSQNSVYYKENPYSKFSYIFITEREDLNQKRMKVSDIKSIIPTQNHYSSFSYVGGFNKNIYKRGEKFFDSKISNKGAKKLNIELENELYSDTVEMSYGVAIENIFGNTVEINNKSYSANFGEDYSYEIITENRLNNSRSIVTNFRAGTENCYIDFVNSLSKLELKLSNKQVRIIGFESEPVKKYKLNTSSNFKVIAVEKDTVYQLKTEDNVFVSRANKNQQLYIFTNATAHEVKLVAKIENQDLHQLKDAEMLIISPSKYMEQAEALAKFHRSFDKLKCIAVCSEEIYNEYSSGEFSAIGIRNFLKDFYFNSTLKPSMVLLFGDGLYNNRFIQEYSIPVYLSENSTDEINSYISDDFYGLVKDGKEAKIDSDDKLDFIVSRLPISSSTHANTVINKIINYCTNPEHFGQWRTKVCFIADDDDNNETVHMAYAENTAQTIEQQLDYFDVKKIYLDCYPQISSSTEESYPEATEDFLNTIKSGVLILNYQGHGSPLRLAHESLITREQIRYLNNRNRLGIWIIGSCDFSPYHEFESISAGEELITNENGGAIALISATKESYASQNYNLSSQFMELLSKKENPRIGEIMLELKNNLSHRDLKDKFVLLGDPAIRIRYRDKDIEIQGVDQFNKKDSIKKLEVINYQINSNFKDNSILQFSIFDSPIYKNSLDNENNGDFSFYSRENKVSSGKTVIKGGKANIEFIIPHDSYLDKNKTLKLHLYTHDSIHFSNEVYQLFVEGENDRNNNDTEGPKIDLKLNNSKFRSGDKSHNKPLLIANLYDESGLNISNSNIGHFTSLKINDLEPINLNKYLDLTNYKSAEILFQLPFQKNGNHKLMLKAWDVYNNSNSSELEFKIEDRFSIESINFYPNPIEKNSKLTAIINKYDENIKSVDVKIYDMFGNFILNTKILDIKSQGTKIGNIEIANLGILKPGNYIVKVDITNNDKQQVNKSFIIVKLR